MTQSNAVKKAVRKYDQANITGLYIKLHKTKDRDILDKLVTVHSKQGYIKQCIRENLKDELLEKQQNIGHWIDKFCGVYRCSKCKKLFSESDVSDTSIKNWKYCPNCGQKKVVK